MMIAEDQFLLRFLFALARGLGIPPVSCISWCCATNLIVKRTLPFIRLHTIGGAFQRRKRDFL